MIRSLGWINEISATMVARGQRVRPNRLLRLAYLHFALLNSEAPNSSNTGTRYEWGHKVSSISLCALYCVAGNSWGSIGKGRYSRLVLDRLVRTGDEGREDER